MAVYPPIFQYFDKFYTALINQTKNQYVNIDKVSNKPCVLEKPTLVERLTFAVHVHSYEETMVFVGNYLQRTVFATKVMVNATIRPKAIEIAKKLTAGAGQLDDGERKMVTAHFDTVLVDEEAPSLKDFFASRVYNQALYHFAKGEYAQVRSCFTVAANLGLKAGKRALGICFHQAIGGKQDMVKAKQLCAEGAA